MWWFRDIEFFAFLMRDTGSREQQRKGADDFMRKRREQKAQDEKSGTTSQPAPLPSPWLAGCMDPD